MSYQSFSFIIFTGVVLLFYYLLGMKRQKYVLLTANLVFYAIAGVKYLPFIFVTLLATYFAGRKIGGIYDQADSRLKDCSTPAEKKAVKADAKCQAKRVLLLGMLITIALLAVCKYTGFVMTNVNSLLVALHLPEMKIFRMILPLGISFYSFMALSYVLDVFWKRYPAERNLLDYAVYLTYFPHVVQGPIDRFNEFHAQIKDGVSLDTHNLVYGSELMIWGFFKKLVIADRIDPFVSHVFTNWNQLDGSILFVAMLAYSVQIYADFSGCIDIVSGASEMFGIKLRKNFNHPYFSKTMGEFWRRWHISLQEWFKDYVYYPVSTSGLLRKAKKYYNGKNAPKSAELVAACLPVVVVWMITGIWHGASWNFVIWGIYHAILLVSSQVFSPTLEKLNMKFRIKSETTLWKFWQMTRTFLLCGFGRIFFRASTLSGAVGYLRRMFTDFSLKGLFVPVMNCLQETQQGYSGSSIKEVLYTLRSMVNQDFGLGITMADSAMAAAAIFVLWFVDILQEKCSLRETLSHKKLWLRWLIIYAGLFAVIIFGIYGPGFDTKSFIYEQF